MAINVCRIYAQRHREYGQLNFDLYRSGPRAVVKGGGGGGSRGAIPPPPGPELNML